MSLYIPAELRQQIRNLDRSRCCYCLTSEAISGIPMAFDHILPRSKGGNETLENLCLSCRPCNEFKSNTVESVDPLTGDRATLFNPRQHKWSEHFSWRGNGSILEGKTPIGRVTVQVLKMNRPEIVSARRRWVAVGWHPPDDIEA